ncbi:uncharacterized protein LOC106178789 [Lingula anatina]|uniref:Uncharacterized protein LOC106178789 n=1 Tax=Lingula anatina TaxID=7574 RepID=A0A1S3K4L9_LINAN|nr:uncharacterized protein LOC106178789 [Lingula anatina]|eukprot:XP_013417578.1 uncharacterized protein LOC106178789 [Lingula anatina]
MENSLRMFVISIVLLLLGDADQVISMVVTGMGTFSYNLSCYECSEAFTDNLKSYEPFTPCQTNLEEVDVRPCGSRDLYCKVERKSFKGQTVTIERGCTQRCLHGCKFTGWGITLMTCTSCCQEHVCNTGNRAPGSLHAPTTQGELFSTLFTTLLVKRAINLLNR